MYKNIAADLEKDVDPIVYRQPNASQNQVIYEALSNEKKLVRSDISEFIIAKYPYCKSKPKLLKSGISKNLDKLIKNQKIEKCQRTIANT